MPLFRLSHQTNQPGILLQLMPEWLKADRSLLVLILLTTKATEQKNSEFFLFVKFFAYFRSFHFYHRTLLLQKKRERIEYFVELEEFFFFFEDQRCCCCCSAFLFLFDRVHVPHSNVRFLRSRLLFRLVWVWRNLFFPKLLQLHQSGSPCLTRFRELWLLSQMLSSRKVREKKDWQVSNLWGSEFYHLPVINQL